MDEKIKRLARNISGLLPEPNSAQQVYDSLQSVMKQQSEYFEHLQPQNIIKLLFYIWSYKQTGDFKLGDKILNEISFAVLFETLGDIYTEDCGYCGGHGEIDCDSCGGDGSVECYQCNGSGEIDCGDCEGKGSFQDEETGTFVDCESCDGTGEDECPECYGDGSLTCNECQNGRVECPECHGETIVETTEQLYLRYFIVTWDNFIKNRCEITEGSNNITMSEYDYDRLRDDYVVLEFKDDKHADLHDFIETSEMYCSYFSDVPALYFSTINGNLQLKHHPNMYPFIK
jgi:hypothetical protein